VPRLASLLLAGPERPFRLIWPKMGVGDKSPAPPLAVSLGKTTWLERQGAAVAWCSPSTWGGCQRCASASPPPREPVVGAQGCHSSHGLPHLVNDFQAPSLSPRAPDFHLDLALLPGTVPSPAGCLRCHPSPHASVGLGRTPPAEHPSPLHPTGAGRPQI